MKLSDQRAIENKGIQLWGGDFNFENPGKSILKTITLTIAHLKIALLGGNSEVGNSEYINHQNCPPQLLCIFSVNMAIGWVLEAYDVYSK